MRMRPIPFPSSCAAITSSTLLSVCRPRVPSSSLPQKVSSTSTDPARRFRPGRTMAIVAAQAQLPLDPDGAGTVLLACDSPHRPKPKRQRFARVLEDCPCCHRALVPATSALQQNPPHRPTLPPATSWTPKTIRPTQLHQILPAGCLCREAGLKFGPIPRVVLHGPHTTSWAYLSQVDIPFRLNILTCRLIGVGVNATQCVRLLVWESSDCIRRS